MTNIVESVVASQTTEMADTTNETKIENDLTETEQTSKEQASEK